MKNVKLIFCLVTILALSAEAQVFDEEDLEPSEFLEKSLPVTSEADCSLVDYRNSFKLKIRNQKKISWCFAHASADGLQIQEKAPVQISAADIAISYSNTTLSKILNFFQHAFDNDPEQTAPEYGLAKVAIRSLKETGYCPESIFPSEDWIRIDAQNKKTIVEVDTAAREIFKLHKVIQDRQKKGETIKADSFPFYYQFRNIDKVTFQNIIKNSKNSEILENMRQLICKDKRVAFKTEIKPKMYFSKRKIVRNINEALNYRKPVSIDFPSKVLKNLNDDQMSLSGLHTVAIQGRKYNRDLNQCMYLLKDSYGDQCSRYDSRIKCEKGYVWIPENHLIKSAISAVILK